ncbi:MAG: BREX-6 system phosphatase PglZ [Thermoanaerobaculia bacterium]|nr:BREX-6 system phosphatase PglZ [Thermoanaerobaculia bacterium]
MPERPVSAALESAVREEVRLHGIVFWLDRDGAYTPFVDCLLKRRSEGLFPVPVVAFRGSYLDTLQALEPYGSGLDPEPLLVHLPGFTEESVRSTPLLELYETGVRFRKALDTLVRDAAAGKVAPRSVEEFLAGPDVSLESADAWLERATEGATGGPGAFLAALKPEALLEALVTGEADFVSRISDEAGIEALVAALERQTGMDEAWRVFTGAPGTGPHGKEAVEAVTSAAVSWVLAMEYVHDLKRAPNLPALKPLANATKPVVATCGRLAAHLRSRQPTLYERLADETEGLLAGELSGMKAEDLGRIDTFRSEELTVLEGAIAAVRAGEHARALEWAEARRVTESFWAERERTHAWEWGLVREAAQLGRLLADLPAPLAGARDVVDALERYTRDAFRVDQAHRRLEQRRVALLEPRLPHFGALQGALALLRRGYRDWSDRLARDFTALCRLHGFLPPSSSRQRSLWDEVVHPLASGLGTTAVLLVDALRYEMAAELAGELRAERRDGAGVELTARLSELPSLTAVGMNALAPVALEGRLRPIVTNGSFEGFRTGEISVRRPADRAKAMGARSTGAPALLLDLKELVDLDVAALARKIRGARLVVVTSREIDDAGEANVGLATFEQTLRQLRSAIFLLEGAGAKRIVVTADHGFLLLDETTAVRPYGSRRDPERRHVFAAEKRQETGMVAVPLSDLGYDGVEGNLLFLEDTTVFATGVTGATFVHGGNSLPERVIPVLVLSDARASASGEAEWRVEAEAAGEVLGLSCLKVRIAPAPGSLAFAERSEVALALRAAGRRDVDVLLRDARGNGAIRGGRLELRSGVEWTEVFFSMEGPTDEKIRVEVFHPDGVVRAAPVSPETWFGVAGRKAGGPPAAQAPAAAAPAWESDIEDEGARKVFVHLARHGSITEVEATRLLGTARAFRTFSMRFDALRARVPFETRVESTPEGKRYVREGER